jgi:predicted nucleic acid-binding protein
VWARAENAAVVLLLDTSFLVPLSRVIAYRCAELQRRIPQRLGENDAWIAATALVYGAELVGREQAFARVPRLRYVAF